MMGRRGLEPRPTGYEPAALDLVSYRPEIQCGTDLTKPRDHPFPSAAREPLRANFWPATPARRSCNNLGCRVYLVIEPIRTVGSG